jgi:mycofactocin precursor
MSPLTLDRPSVETDLIDLDLIEDDDELLIEEISIDGMCGVY